MMNRKYNVAGLALGTLVALAPATAFGQGATARPQVRQKPTVRSAAPSGAAQTTTIDPSDLPIGVQQGLADAKRYQELRRLAERQGQAPPPLPYTPHNPFIIIFPPTTAGAVPPYVAPATPGAVGFPTPGGATAQPPFQPVLPPGGYAPVEPPPAAYGLQSPMASPVQSNFTFGQTPPPPPARQMSPAMRQLQQLQEYMDYINGRSLDTLPDCGPAMPSAPITMPSGGGAIQMSVPASGGGLTLSGRP